MWGGGISLAYAVQAAASLTAVGSVAWLWRSSADRNLKAAALIVATLLCSPHVLDYDLTILACSAVDVSTFSIPRGLRRTRIGIIV